MQRYVIMFISGKKSDDVCFTYPPLEYGSDGADVGVVVVDGNTDGGRVGGDDEKGDQVEEEGGGWGKRKRRRGSLKLDIPSTKSSFKMITFERLRGAKVCGCVLTHELQICNFPIGRTKTIYPARNDWFKLGLCYYVHEKIRPE